MNGSKTIIINLFGGPGSGKSTTAAGLFHYFKIKHLKVELVTEYAKDLLFDERHHTLARDQIYVFAKQYARISRLIGKVDIVVTDSPISFSCIYGNELFYHEQLKQLVESVNAHYADNSINIFLKRESFEYVRHGRYQDESGANEVSNKIVEYLTDNSYKFETYDAGHFLNDEHKEILLEKIQQKQKELNK